MRKSMILAIGVLAVVFAACSNSTDSHDFNATGTVVSFGECKEFPSVAGVNDVPADQNCLEYYYDGESILLLRHLNGRFNCCPDSLTADFTIATVSILIEEIEWASQPCDCICLYDLDYKITDLPLGTYTITVDEPYRSGSSGLLEVTVDLKDSPQGSFCVPRDKE